MKAGHRLHQPQEMAGKSSNEPARLRRRVNAKLLAERDVRMLYREGAL
jgi:hypothetical protein